MARARTKNEARSLAHKLWGTDGIEPGDRVGFVVIRRKNVVDRFEVGYYTRAGQAPSGATMSTNWTVMGKGRSWEEAFERASKGTPP